MDEVAARLAEEGGANRPALCRCNETADDTIEREDEAISSSAIAREKRGLRIQRGKRHATVPTHDYNRCRPVSKAL